MNIIKSFITDIVFMALVVLYIAGSAMVSLGIYGYVMMGGLI